MRLLKAIAAVGKLKELSWSAPEVVTLQACLNRAIQSLAPTTLADLRRNWEPMGSLRSRARQLIFVLATVAVMVVTALCTFEYNRGVALLKAASAVQEHDPRSSMGSILRQLLAVRLASATNDAAAVVLDEPHYLLVDKLHEIDTQLALYLPALSKFRREHSLPHEFVLGQKTTLTDDVTKRINSPGYNQGKCGTAAPAPTLASNAATQPPATPQASTTLVAEADVAPPPVTAASNPVAPVTEVDVVEALGRYLKKVEAVACIASLTYGPLTIPSVAGAIDEMINWSNIWGLWYLPALYGALGAMLYYMRRILDPTIPDPSAVRIIHRTALGAFAGIIVTWFWAPNAELTEGFTSIGITIFTLAFLVGFGIEILFSLLDRLVGTMIDVAKGNDRTPPPPPLPNAT